jgi:hypothetical protein
MFKLLAVLALFTTSIYAKTTLPSEALIAYTSHLNYGNNNLLAGNFSAALENYDLAAATLQPESEYHFAILFGKIIAYDCLHQKALVEQSLGALILNTIAVAQAHPEIEDPTNHIGDTELENMKKLAALAQSPTLRLLLVSTLEDDPDDTDLNE